MVILQFSTENETKYVRETLNTSFIYWNTRLEISHEEELNFGIQNLENKSLVLL